MNVWLCFLLSVLGCVSLLVLAQENKCPKLTLKNGRVRMRGAGRMAYFRCKKKFKRVGHKLAVCLSGSRWSQQTPVCVGRGCPDFGPLPDVTVTEKYNGGVLQFSCPEGMRREGPQQLMCDGTNWDKEPPKCLFGNSPGCDFEDSGLCGWIQDSDDDFDWTWTSGSTPTIKTGPDGDHTTGSGHYLFMESSAPQKAGHIARLISPTYHPTSEEMCLEFFYHMKGPKPKSEVGDLDVYVRTTTADGVKDISIFHRNSYQGGDWIKGQVNIPEQSELYRIVFAATRRESWTGDIALDDIRTLNCSEKPQESEQTTSQPSTTGFESTSAKIQSSSPTTAFTTTPTPSSTTIKITSTATPSTTTSSTRTPLTTTTTIQSPAMPITRPMPTAFTTPDLSTWIPTVVTSTMAYSSTLQKSTQSKTVDLSSSISAQWTSYTTASGNKGTKILQEGTTSTVQILQTTVSDGDTDTYIGQTSASFIHSTSSEYSIPHVDITAPLSSQAAVTDEFDTTETYKQTTPLLSTEDTKPGKNGDTTISDYLPLIVGISLAVVVGLAVVSVLAWMWARNRRKQKELRVEEDQLNIIGSIEASSYCYPPSGSEH